MIINYIRFCKILGLLSLATTIGAQTLPKVTLSQQVQSNNLSETADTVFVSKFLNVDTATLYVDAVNNRVAIGQTQTLEGAALSLRGGLHLIDPDTTKGTDLVIYAYPKEQTTAGANAAEFGFFLAGPGSTSVTQGPIFSLRGNNFSRFANYRGTVEFYAGRINDPTGFDGSISFYTGSSYNMFISPNSNVGIKTTAPSYDLHVVDDIFASDSIIATTVTQTSDARLKTDIDNLDNGLILIQSLNPVAYRLIQNENNENKNFGFIAQEVEPFIPSLVSERFDGMKVLNYIDIIPITVKAIQEQQQIIETQKTEIETLKTQINDLLQRIINLENK